MSWETLGSTSGTPRQPLRERLDEVERAFQVALPTLHRAANTDLPAPAEWLLDNDYLLRRTIRLCRTDLSRGREGRLPRLAGGPDRGEPRVYVLAQHLLEAAQGALDEEELRTSVASFEGTPALSIGELWALPVALRLSALQRLAGTTRDLLDGSEHATSEVRVRDCVRALHTLEKLDWRAFFEATSRVERTLREDPAGVYAAMDFATRNHYREGVEELARRSGLSEEQVARGAIESARRAQPQALPSHVGHHLVGGGRPAFERELGARVPLTVRLRRACFAHPTLCYLGSVGALTSLQGWLLCAALSAAAVTPVWLVAAASLALVPALTAAVALTNWLVTSVLPPRVLAKMSYQDGLPTRCRTLVAVPCLLSSASAVTTLLEELEIRYLGNRDPELGFALLSDFLDADAETTPADEALLRAAAEGIADLNRSHVRVGTAPFHLLHRRRLWNEREGRWMGWERKRGKLEELNRLLLGQGQDTSFSERVGDAGFLGCVRFVITLDADTELPPGAARKLVATLDHPFNRAVFDPSSGRVVSGYTVLQPRVEVTPGGEWTAFARLFSADTVLDLYSRAVSDAYQDLFGEGTFVGKGIYEVRAFERSLRDRAPENALLSHDLFEGVHGRAGLVTDVTLLEDYPRHYLTFSRRLHRWIRGDWQLLPWLGWRVPSASGQRLPTPLTAFARWRLLDNLRRSLLAPTLLAFLVLAWSALPGFGALTAWALCVLALPALVGFSASLLRTARTARLGPLLDPLHELPISAGQWLLRLLFLPHEAAVCLDAIARTLVRLYVTRRGLLEWTPAAHGERALAPGRGLLTVWLEMRSAPLLALAVAVLLAATRPVALAWTSPLLLGWALSPLLAFWVSRTRPPTTDPPDAASRERLRLLARRTWLFFQQFVGPEDQWLPPDNVQEKPGPTIAHRTSPTNIGLLLASTVAALDLGYVGPRNLALRLRSSLETLWRLERYQGHFLNWYDTRTLRPLEPRYVSTVDNGNLAACLIVVERACLELLDSPFDPAPLWKGLADDLSLCRQAVLGSSGPSGVRDAILEALAALERGLARATTDLALESDVARALLEDQAAQLDRSLGALVALTPPEGSARVEEAMLWAGLARRHLASLSTDLALSRPWCGPLQVPGPLVLRREGDRALGDSLDALAALLGAAPPLRDIGDVCRQALQEVQAIENTWAQGDPLVRAWLEDLERRLCEAEREARAIVADLRACMATSGALLEEADFGLLYDERRHLFHIGFRVSEERPDPNHYDLLASEARLTSFLALAFGQVPQDHWLHLGRPLTRVAGELALVSWSGTAFEYLMPALWLGEAPGGLLARTCHAAVREQIRYARQLGVPWGISESGFQQFDAQHNYQYRAFGVPSLGYKRGLGDDLVVAPYASLLALRLAPAEVHLNLARLEALGLSGQYGMREALDMTPSRMEAGERQAVIQSYMAHHQGMILLSVANHLTHDAIVRRFHADPRVRTVQRLLHEGQPRRPPLERLHAQEPPGAPSRERRSIPWRCPRSAPFVQAHALSNGRLTTVITGTGGGSTSWRGIALTPWSADPTLDEAGLRVYVRDEDTRRLWIVGRGAAGDAVDLTCYEHRAEVHHVADGLAAALSLVVPPDDDLEVRHLHLTNRGDRPRRVTVCSYGEVLLGDLAEGLRHPAFSRLFVHSRYDEALGALIFTRRPRSADETSAVLLHTLLVPAGQRIDGHESARDVFLGRGRTPRAPQALTEAGPVRLRGTAGWTLDPVLALATTLELPAHATVELAFLTVAGSTEEDVLGVATRYRSLAALERAREEARHHFEAGLRGVRLEAARLPLYQRLLSLLLYPHRALRADPATLARNRQGPSRLWGHSISGDLPVLVLCLADARGTTLLAELLAVHEVWRTQRIHVDLVVLNEQQASYESSVADRVHRLIGRAGARQRLNRRGGVFLLQGSTLSPEARTLLLCAARVVLDGASALETQLERALVQVPALPAFHPVRSSPLDPAPTPPLERPRDLLFDNGLGGFSPDGKEYLVHLEEGRLPPAPWANVVANRELGFLATTGGCGSTWSLNAGLNRITPWLNDPVSDPTPETLYLRDEETSHSWTPTPLPAPGPGAYQVRHGAGHTTYVHHSHQLRQRLRLFLGQEDPVKVYQLELHNTSASPRRVTATLLVEWILGGARHVDGPYVIPEFEAEHEVLLARNPWNEPFAQRVTFLAASLGLHGVTGDRTEVLGVGGDRARPQALERVGLSGAVAAGQDPCGALQVHLELPAHGRAEVHFFLGQANSRQEGLDLVKRYREPGAVARAWEESGRGWDRLLGAVSVETPDPALNLLVNRWLLYQALASRLWGRTGLYQSSGAYGFRDQLQDALALVHAQPGLLEERILDAARHQFPEGDVLHWWHPGTERGLRSRCSDDLLWLPFATAHYVRATGDRSILSRHVPWLRGDPLAPEALERYGDFQESDAGDTLYAHCLAAIERGSSAGSRGLPLFGTGDWNDGMNRVGALGRGESVWLGWFLHAVLTDFAPLCTDAGEHETALRLKARAERLARAIEENGWDGAWYARGFYDDGAPLGSASSQECRMDSIAQSWSALSAAGDPARAGEALEQAWRRLVRVREGLVLLLAPPFQDTARDPGYIKGYAPGVRENGGQYTHAAAWLGLAFAARGDGERAYQILRLVTPIRHATTPDEVETYRVEPYVVAGDVYAVPPHVGRGGWTWYTGSAAWLYRLAVEGILGLRLEGGALRICPCLPAGWTGFGALVRHGGASYRIQVERGGQERAEVRLDGALLGEPLVPLCDDGREHTVLVRLS